MLEPDFALARRAQRGDRGAFEQLIQRHKESVYRLARRYVGNADDAYDILQETWISVWEALSRLDAERPFLPWVRVIALNKCRDFSRRQRFMRAVRQAFWMESEQSTLSAAEQSQQDGATLERERELSRLDAAIGELPTFYKEPLVLAIAAELSHEEIAAVLKTSKKAVEMRLRRARQQLSKRLLGA